MREGDKGTGRKGRRGRAEGEMREGDKGTGRKGR